MFDFVKISKYLNILKAHSEISKYSKKYNIYEIEISKFCLSDENSFATFLAVSVFDVKCVFSVGIPPSGHAELCVPTTQCILVSLQWRKSNLRSWSNY